jgi:type II secretory pathway pseudopilin PulG
MLVVIAIIGILLAVVFRGGSALLRSSKARDTEALLAKLNLALDEYRREVDHSRIPNSMALFNKFPPDDLRVFDASSSDASAHRRRLRSACATPGVHCRRRFGFASRQTARSARQRRQFAETGRVAPRRHSRHGLVHAVVLAQGVEDSGQH